MSLRFGSATSHNNNNNTKSLVHKRNAIKFGTDELRNLDAAGNDDDDETKSAKSQNYAQMKDKATARFAKRQEQQKQRRSQPGAAPSSVVAGNIHHKRRNSEDEGNDEEKRPRPFGVARTDNARAQQDDPQPQRSHLYMPPEARLARWSFVARHLFPSFGSPSTNSNSTRTAPSSSSLKRLKGQNRQKIALLLEALERIDRWKRVTATHGMMMRLRKIPTYIEATKSLVEAIHLDRHLQELREDLWRANDDDDIGETENEKESEHDDEENQMDDDDDDDDEETEDQIGGGELSPSNPSSPVLHLLAQSNSNDSKQFPIGGDAQESCKDAPNPSSSSSSTTSAMIPLHQQITASALPSIYANAITRAVFELTESQRKFSDQLDSSSTFRQRAENIELPAELTEARNQIAHGRMPTLAQLRFATSLGLQYLHDFFWVPNGEILKKYRAAKEGFEQKRQAKGGNSEKNRIQPKIEGKERSDNQVPTSSQQHFGMRRQREEEANNNKSQSKNKNGGGANGTMNALQIKKMLTLEQMKAKMQAMKK